MEYGYTEEKNLTGWHILIYVVTLLVGIWIGDQAAQADGHTATYWEQQYKTTKSEWDSVDYCIGDLTIFYDFDREGRGYNVLDAESVKSCEEGQGN